MTADIEGRSCGTGCQSVLGNNKNNKNPFSLPRAGTTTLPSLKIKPSSQVTKWGARSERVNQKNKHPHRQSINPPSLSLRYNFNGHTASFWHTASFFFLFFFCMKQYEAIGTQPFSPSRHTAAHSLAMHPPSRRPLSAFWCPAAAVAAPRIASHRSIGPCMPALT